MIKRACYLIFIFASVISNSHSYINLLEELAGKADVIEDIITKGICSAFLAESKSEYRDAILALIPTELRYFKSKEDYFDNRDNAIKAIEKWIRILIKNHELFGPWHSEEDVEKLFGISYKDWKENLIQKTLDARILYIEKAFGRPFGAIFVKIPCALETQYWG